MGLIKALTGSVSSVVGDQFKEYVTLPAVDGRALVIRGQVNHGDANPGATDGIISNGSKIVIPEGYAMMIVENGAIKEFSAEAGEFVWDTSAEPSVFEGGFFKGIGDSIKKIGSRITYGGQTAQDQRVYYINFMNIMNNPFGSQQPITIHDPVYESVEITYNGEYSFKVADPTLLISKVLGSNPKDVVTADDVVGGQLKTQFSSNVGTAISNLMVQNDISFNEVQGYRNKIVEIMNDLLDESWGQQYGLEILDVALNINASEESREIIREMDKEIASTRRMAKTYSDNMAGAMAAATGESMKSAAANPNGSMMGFMGANMAGQYGASAMGAFVNPEQAAAEVEKAAKKNPDDVVLEQAVPVKAVETEEVTEEAAPAAAKFCTECGAPVTGKFCGQCGAEIK